MVAPPIFLHIFMLIRYSHENKIDHCDCSPWAHSELTVSSPWPKWSQPAVTKPLPGPWLSCDLAVIILRMPWLSCNLAVTELWPSRNWAVTSPWLSCDLSYNWAVIIGPGAVTTMVRVSSRWAHSELTVTIFFSWADISKPITTSDLCCGLYEIGPWALV